MKLKSLITIFILICLSSTANAEIFYKVTEGDKTIWILGTLHVGTPDQLKLSSSVKDALEKSDNIWLELDPEKMGHAQQVFMSHASRDEGSLSESLMPETWQSLAAVGSDYGLPSEALDQLSAWFAQMVLISQALVNAGFNMESGIEGQVLALIEDSSKNVYGLETVERQLDALLEAQDNAGEEEIVQQLLAELDVLHERMSNLAEAWSQGDLETLMSFFSAEMPKEAMEAILFSRNREWVERLNAETDSGHVFVAVGAGHLGGEDGLVELFERQGAHVERVQ